MNADNFLDQYYTSRNESTYYDHEQLIHYQATSADSSFVTVSMVIKVPHYQTIIYVPQMA